MDMVPAIVPFPNFLCCRTHQIVLLGDANVGKSSIVTRFITEQFDTEIKNTVGAAFVTKTVETDGESVKFQIWDTAGQGSYRAFFLYIHIYYYWRARTHTHTHTHTHAHILRAERFRSLAKMYYQGTKAAICVFDTTVQVSRKSIMLILNTTVCARAPFFTIHTGNAGVF